MKTMTEGVVCVIAELVVALTAEAVVNGRPIAAVVWAVDLCASMQQQHSQQQWPQQKHTIETVNHQNIQSTMTTTDDNIDDHNSLCHHTCSGTL